ncbi:hypothetical protein ABB02_01980 [Clostridiaceae bacterium JG1575]|nr:hypothetical protein ABB02_01980 [Clostridiaceae bacterium JG1575]
MGKIYSYIDGHRFAVKVDGMTLVGSYYIPDDLVDEYLRNRKELARKARRIFKKYCHSVCRDFKGSQDGEALIGLDEHGKIKMFIHLDPDGIDAMRAAEDEGTLEQFLLDYQD